MSDSGLDVDADTLDARAVPHPAHSWETAKRCIREACPADQHDWRGLSGVQAYWRECRECGIADVTAAALGQTVATPNDDRAADEQE